MFGLQSRVSMNAFSDIGCVDEQEQEEAEDDDEIELNEQEIKKNS
jgi:hypothetical protein